MIGGDGMLGNLLEIKDKIVPSEDVKTVTFLNYGIGSYIIIGYPVMTAARALTSPYAVNIQAYWFIVRQSSSGQALSGGTLLDFKNNGTNDYWPTSVAFNDDKTTITITANGAGKFMAGVEYYLLKVKEQ